MAGTETITLRLVAQDLMSGNVTKAMGSIDKLARKGGIAGSLLQGVGQSFGQMLNPAALAANAIGAVTQAVGDSVAAYREDQLSQEKLRAALLANIDSWNGNTDAIEAVIKARMDLAFSDDEQRDSLASIVASIHDVNDALALQRTAMDLARLRNISLSDASEALTKAYNGNTTGLRRMGFQAAAGARGLAALTGVTKAASGQAEAFARTSTGSMARLDIKVGELQESFGALVEGPLVGFVGFLTDAVDGLAGLGDAFTDLKHLIDPTSESVDRIRSYLRKQADALGLNADKLVAYYDAQLAAADAAKRFAEEHDSLVRDLQTMPDAWSGIADDEKNRTIARTVAAIEALGKDIGDIPYAFELARTTLADFGGTTGDLEGLVESVRAQLGLLPRDLETSASAAADMTEAMRVLAASVRAATAEDLVNSMQGFWTGTARGAKRTQEQVQEATGTIIRIATELGPSIADGIRSGMDEVRQASQDLKWAMTHPFAAVDSVANIRGKLFGKKLRDGLKSTNPLQREQARRTREIYLAQLRQLAEDGYVKGYDAGAALIDGLRASGVLQQVAGLFGLGGARQYQETEADRRRRRRERRRRNKRRAHGGPVGAGETYLVGEDGPELLTMGARSGYVIPNDRLRTATGSTITVHVTHIGSLSEAEGDRLAAVIEKPLRRRMARAGL